MTSTTRTPRTTQFSGLPEDAADPRFDLMTGLAIMDQGRASYIKARLYYDGRVDEWSADPRIAEVLEQSSRSYPFRFAAVPVDTLAERVRLTTIQVDDEAQDAWNDIYDGNDMKSWSSYQHFNTFLYGDSYLRVWPAPEDEELNPRNLSVELTYLSPLNAVVVYGSNPKVGKFAVHRWAEESPEALKNPNAGHFRADVYYHDRVERWRTAQAGSDGTGYRDWAPFAEEDAPHIEYYNFEVEGLPIKHCRNKLVYGAPEHEAAYGPQNALMKHLITELATVDTQGWPVRMLLADPAAVLDRANDTPDFDEDDDGTEIPVSEAGPVASSMREAPGIVQILDGIAKTASFEASDPSHLIDPVIKMYLPMMAVVTRTPLYEFFGSMGEEASGKSKAAADGPINKKIERIQTLFIDFWEEVVHAALAISDNFTDQIQVGFAPSKMVSDKESWEAMAIMLQSGVPFDVVMKQHAGFDPVTVDSWEEPPKPWEQPMGMNTPGMSSDPRGQRGGPNTRSNPTALGTNPKAQEGPS